jgi:hypothetical protein
MRRKNLILALAFGLFVSFATPGFASLGVKLDGGPQKAVKTLNLTGPNSLTKTNGALNLSVVDSTMIAAGVANGGPTSMTTTTLAVPTGFSYVNMDIRTSDPAFTAKTLANGTPGSFLILNVYTGSNATTITPATSTGFSKLTFNAVGDNILLFYIDDTFGWVHGPSTSVTITP